MRRIILCQSSGSRSSRRSCMRDGTTGVDDWFGELLMAGKIFREISLLDGGAAPKNVEQKAWLFYAAIGVSMGR